MSKKISKIGLVLAGIYLLTTVGLVLYSFSCHTEFCGFVTIVSAMPWNFVLPWLFPSLSFLNSFSGYWIIVFVNMVVLYFVGQSISYFLSRRNY